MYTNPKRNLSVAIFLQSNMKIIGLLFTAILVGIYTSILKGLALCYLWGWFVVPIFHLPPLSIPVAIGLGYIGNHFTYKYKKEEKGETLEEIVPYILEKVIFQTLYFIFALAFGWTVAQFV